MKKRAKNELHKRDDLDVGKIALITILGTIIMIVIVLWLRVLYFSLARGEDYNKYLSIEPRHRDEAWTEQRRQVNEVRWISRKDGVVAIPIERAKNLVLQDLGVKTSTRADS